MSDPGLASPKPSFWRERIETFRAIWALGKAAVLGAIAWLLILGGYQTLVTDWLPPEKTLWMSKPYQVVGMIWPYLSTRTCFVITGVILSIFSFEDYNRIRVGKQSITPLFLFVVALLAFTIGILVNPTESKVTSSIPSITIDEIVNKQTSEIENLKSSVAVLQKGLQQQIRIDDNVKLAKQLSDIASALPDIIDRYNNACVNSLPSPAPYTGPNVGYRGHAQLGIPLDVTIVQSAKSVGIPAPDLTTAGSFDTNRPAPGQEAFDTEEKKYLFRVAYWKCKASAIALARFNVQIQQKLVAIESDKQEVERQIRSLPLTNLKAPTSVIPALPTLPGGK